MIRSNVVTFMHIHSLYSGKSEAPFVPIGLDSTDPYLAARRVTNAETIPWVATSLRTDNEIEIINKNKLIILPTHYLNLFYK